MDHEHLFGARFSERLTPPRLQHRSVRDRVPPRATRHARAPIGDLGVVADHCDHKGAMAPRTCSAMHRANSAFQARVRCQASLGGCEPLTGTSATQPEGGRSASFEFHDVPVTRSPSSLAQTCHMQIVQGSVIRRVAIPKARKSEASPRTARPAGPSGLRATPISKAA